MGVQRSALHVAFGVRLREVRLERGLSQDELGTASGLHRTYIGGVERGERNPGLANIARLASALGISVAQLTDGIDD